MHKCLYDLTASYEFSSISNIAWSSGIVIKMSPRSETEKVVTEYQIDLARRGENWFFSTVGRVEIKVESLHLSHTRPDKHKRLQRVLVW